MIYPFTEGGKKGKYGMRCNRISYCQEIRGKGLALIVDRLFDYVTIPDVENDENYEALQRV